MQTPRTSQVDVDDVEVAIRSHCASVRRKASSGVVMVEYAFLVVFFCVPVMLASAALGIRMIKGYGEVRNDQVHVGP